MNEKMNDIAVASDREVSKNKTIFNVTVYDDGWDLPKEIVEEINLRVVSAKNEALKRVIKQHNNHRGKWLTREIADHYWTISWVFRVLSCGQYTGKVREFGIELQKEYGVTELEAINILFGNHVGLICNRYYRMKNYIPDGVNIDGIKREVLDDYNYNII